jgi:ech hydrogenase subunit F
MANPLNLPMIRRSLRNLVSRPATRRYPTEVRPRFAGARGTIEFDLDSCVFCGLCVRRCPAVALSCSREEKWFAIEQLRCIACGVCVDVCNKNSLSMSVDARPVHTHADVGPHGERPGHEEWHKEEPPVAKPTVQADPAAGGASLV